MRTADPSAVTLPDTPYVHRGPARPAVAAHPIIATAAAENRLGARAAPAQPTGFDSGLTMISPLVREGSSIASWSTAIRRADSGSPLWSLRSLCPLW